MSVFDKFRLDGKRALITGGSRGLGRAMAQALAEAGADLVLVGRESSHLETAARELAVLKHRVDVMTADIGTLDVAQHTCDRALAEFGPIHILINNVGGRRINVPTEQLSLVDWQRIIDLIIGDGSVDPDQLRHARGRRLLNFGRECSSGHNAQNHEGKHEESYASDKCHRVSCFEPARDLNV